METGTTETKVETPRDNANGNVSINEKPPHNNHSGVSGNRGGRGGGGGGGPRSRFSGRDSGRGGPMGRPYVDIKKEMSKDDGGLDDDDKHRRGMRGGMKRFRGNTSGIQGGGGGGPIKDLFDRGLRNQDDRFNERLSSLAGHTRDIPPSEGTEKKFNGRCRLYIGNLNDISEEEIKEMFKPYGEYAELFVNKEKNFAFIRMDYRVNAEKAKRELDGTLRKNRQLKVRFAPLSSIVKVKNLNQWVTNELLEKAFQVFGEVERAIVITDERSKSTGEGIVEFARKPGAAMALRRCQEGCYFLTSSLRPVIVEPYEIVDDIDGHSEKNLPKKNPDYYKERENGPRFASSSSFEHDYGTRWKQLHELYKQKDDALKRELRVEEEKLEVQMEYAKYEHETEILREQLRQREQDRERQKREWELKERQVEEQRRQDDEMMRRQNEEMQLRNEDVRRRQQENTLFMQAHQLNTMLDQQEQAIRSNTGGGYDSPHDGAASHGGTAHRDYDSTGGAATHGNTTDPKTFMEPYDRMNRGGGYNDIRDEHIGVGGGIGGGRGGGRGRWAQSDRRGGGGSGSEDFPHKRRRY